MGPCTQVMSMGIVHRYMWKSALDQKPGSSSSKNITWPILGLPDNQRPIYGTTDKHWIVV